MKKYLLLALLLLAACGQPAQSNPTVAVPTLAITASLAPSATPLSATAMHTRTPMASPKPTSTATLTPLPTHTPSPTVAPTYAILRGTVNVGQAVCHYGPGQPYLYKYGVIQGNRLEIIRRVQPGTYVEVRAIGGDNPCWLNPEYLDITGDLQSVQPVAPEEVKIPFSPYYPNPVAGVSATRSGTQVSIAWTPYVLKAGDDSEQYPYLIEAWVCRAGEIIFEPKGFYQPVGVIEDQPGCAEPSHAKLYAVDKHGYTPWIEIPWPPAN